VAGSRLNRSTYEELQLSKDGGAPTLEQISEERGLELLSSAVQGEQATATFACGGSINICDDNTSTNKMGQLSSPPVVIRWDNPDKTATHRVELPRPRGQGQELDKLISDCQPATFGLHGVDVLDESYRKASKLDSTEFSTNFSPYDYGIVDTIAQILFPSVEENNSGDLGLELRGVRAELYKLNVFSNPLFASRWQSSFYYIRSTLALRECSTLMSTHRVEKANLAHWSSVSLLFTPVANCLSVIKETPSHSTGALPVAAAALSNGLPSIATANMRCSKLLAVTGSPCLTTYTSASMTTSAQTLVRSLVVR